MNFKSFEDMPIWQQSVQIAKDIYHISEKAPFVKDYALKDQIRRAIVSVSSNIVEGYERSGNREFVRFLCIAKGSINEARSQLILAREIGYVEQIDASILLARMKNLSQSIANFISYLKRYEKQSAIRNQ